MVLLGALTLHLGLAGRIIPFAGLSATSELAVGWRFGEHVEAGLRGEVGLLADRVRDPSFALALPFAAYLAYRASSEGLLRLALEADGGAVQLASERLGRTVVGTAGGWAGVEVAAFDRLGVVLLAGAAAAFYPAPPAGEFPVQAVLGARAGVVLSF